MFVSPSAVLKSRDNKIKIRGFKEVIKFHEFPLVNGV